MLASLALGAALAGCHSMHFDVAHIPSVEIAPPIRDHKAFWVAGIAPTQDIDVRQVCPHGVAAIEEETTFTDGLLTILTLSIYSPRTSDYYCRLYEPPPPPPPAPVTSVAPGVTP